MQRLPLYTWHILAAAALVTPTVAVYTPKTLTVVMVAAAIAVYFIRFVRSGRLALSLDRISLTLLAICAVGVASGLWSVDPADSVLRAIKLAGLLLFGTVIVQEAKRMPASGRAIFERGFAIGLGLAIALLMFEWFSGLALTRFIADLFPEGRRLPTGKIAYGLLLKPAMAVLATIAWPGAIMLWRRDRRTAAAVFLLVMLVLLGQFESRATTVALLGGFMFAGLIYVLRGRGWSVIAGLIVVGVMVVPFATATLVNPKAPAVASAPSNPSYLHRLVIWQFAAGKITERPILGWGLGMSRSIPGGDDPPGGKDNPYGFDPNTQALPLHPHNAALQLWLELGIPGAMLGAGLVVAVLMAIRRTVADRALNAACFGLVFTAGVFALLSFSTWQSWWLSTVWLTAAFTVAALGSSRSADSDTVTADDASAGMMADVALTAGGAAVISQRAKSRKQEAGLVLGGLVLAIAIAEIALRAFGISYPIFHRLESLRGWAPQPEVSGTWMVEGRSEVNINREGFRDREHAVEKPANTIRIAVLGDSMAESFSVPIEKTFWSVLERKIASCSAFAGRAVEVINFSVSGYGTAQELLTLRNNALKYDPDIVLLAFYTGNDVWNNNRALDDHPDRVYFHPDGDTIKLDDSNTSSAAFKTKAFWRALVNRTINSSHALQVIRESYNRLKTRLRQSDATAPLMDVSAGENGVFLPPADENWAAAWTATEHMLRAMRDDSQTHGARFVVTTLSTPIQVYPDRSARRQFMENLGIESLTYPDQRMAAFGAEEGIPVVTLVDRLRAHADGESVYLHGFDNSILGYGHWNEAGHRLAGENISEELCRIETGT